MLDLDEAIKQRHSTRNFLPKPVPRALLDEALSLAQLAPSNSNIQPWHLVVVSGPARDRLVAALVEASKCGPPAKGAALPERFQHLRFELGSQIYGSMGIGRDDKAGRAAAISHNWEFFHAPVAAVVCLQKDLGPADALSVGMFLQTFLLALSERGVGSCVQVSVAGYPDVLMSQLGIPSELSILCGLAIGYADPDYPMNKVHVGREPIQNNVAFVDS
jgi:nitroreductase